jgi:pimeloyl-ACP methyl ester carboxylesterase
MVVARMTEPVDLVAQSMGGVIAARIALAHPQLVRRLVLTVTSGGVDMTAFGASDWRPTIGVVPQRRAWILEPARRAAAGRAHRRADPAAVGRCRSDQPAGGGSISRSAARCAAACGAGGDHDLARRTPTRSRR